MTSNISEGEMLECRTARLFARQGYFVRRRVNLNRWFEPEKLQITDLDVLVYDFREDLTLRRLIGECKHASGKSAPKTVDRILVLAGLMQLTGADEGALVTKKKANQKVRALGETLDVVVLDLDDLDRREHALGIDTDPFWGSHHPDLVALEAGIHRMTRTDRELERLYWFLRSDFWQLEPILGMKRALTAVATLSKKWVEGLKREEEGAARWLMADAITAFVVAAVTTARSAMLHPETEFRAAMLHDLSGGVASPAELNRLSDAVDRLVVRVLEQNNVPQSQIVKSLGAFQPRPPVYANTLLELLVRLASQPVTSKDLPKVVDLVLCHQWKLGGAGMPDLTKIRVLDVAGTQELARKVTAFLAGQFKLPDAVVDSFRAEQESMTGGVSRPAQPQEEELPLATGDATSGGAAP